MAGSHNPNIDLEDEGTKRRPTLAGAPTRLMVREILDDEGNVVGHKLVSDTIKFREREEKIVVEELSKHGRIGTAARRAGVTIGTVKRHVERNQGFAEAVAEAIEVYKDRLLEHHQRLVFEGIPKETYDRNGALISRTTEYPIRLIEMELKKHDPAYREKQEFTHEHKGGVMIAPTEVENVDDWERRFGRPKDVVDGEIIDSESDKSED